jgi:hypothetical protein
VNKLNLGPRFKGYRWFPAKNLDGKNATLEVLLMKVVPGKNLWQQADDGGLSCDEAIEIVS